MSSLDMGGFIDSDFVSIPANQISQTGGGYDGDGIWVPGAESTTPYAVNIQPLNPRDIDSLQIGGERVNDYRRIYINQGDFHALSPKDFWEFDANNNGVERYKVVALDNRGKRPEGGAWRNYAKIIVCLIDGAPND